MNPDKINPGDKGCDPINRLFCWHNDMANDLHNDDALWFWTAKASYRFMEWRDKGVIDLVFHCLFAMGLFDWTAPNDYLNQTTSAMHHATVMGMKLFHQIHENDQKVPHPLSFLT